MYELEGIKWGDPTFGTPSGTINWQDDLSGLSTSGGGSLASTLNTAFSAWENVAAVNFQDSGGGIDLQIGSASFSSDGIPGNNGAAATASWSTGGGSIEPTDATITFNSDLTWSASGAGGTNFYVVALHEIGHIIGLGHVSDQSEIMNSVIYANDLGDGDIEGAQTLYGTDGSDVPVPPSGGGDGISGGGGDGGGGGAGAIGLIVGLLALVIGLFTGGAGAAVAVAAGRMATDEERDDATDAADTDDFDNVDIALDGTMTVTHTTFLADMPMIDFGPAPVMDEDEEFEDFFII